ncbi:hypothetical protein BKA67DRAFT_75759 [Truncatella angustata]|uniref:Secreted protein n=1 Tax=Truncatella angustata TaxID=152316 RepID=A0A9P9A436_9PEZI|nr:uncharacterized protein BKA67DRAFT_75759 [Truncatella angustata]KAH6661127.1 hypothetical protein BKA67DRAFT_75759 [Truncatella angustata]
MGAIFFLWTCSMAGMAGMACMAIPMPMQSLTPTILHQAETPCCDLINSTSPTTALPHLRLCKSIISKPLVERFHRVRHGNSRS